MAPSNSSSSPSSLAGKSALVTGGSRGIGAAIALQFAKKGITGLAVTYANSKEAADAVLAECRALGVAKTVAVHASLLDPEIGPNLIPKVLAGLETKTLDIIVNNAFVADFATMQPFESISLDGFSKQMNGNVFGMISIIQAALPHLPAKGGRVINTSSVASKIGNNDPVIVYGASKAAVDSITRSLAVVYGAKTGATFNSVSVGATLTEATKKVVEAGGQQIIDDNVADVTAEKRMGLPEDIALVFGFLASEEARWINGANVAANGGAKSMLALQG
jgi:3-oxoacyl-[acyl-carrier protein] reductase